MTPLYPSHIIKEGKKFLIMKQHVFRMDSHVPYMAKRHLLKRANRLPGIKVLIRGTTPSGFWNTTLGNTLR